ncbi:GGDEF domain-containing protein [Allohahella marinimesophila]
MYVWFLIPLGLATWSGNSPVHVAVIWMLIGFGGNAVFYAMLSLGYNKRFTDHSLTIPQMWLAIIVTFYAQIYAGPLRGGYLLALILMFIFGCFKLRTKQMLWVSLSSSFIYAATIPLAAIVEGPAFNWVQSLILWFIYTTIMPMVSVVAGVVSRMRHDLAANRSQLQAALEEVTHLASHDELTGLSNRRWMMETLERERALAQRRDSGFCLCIVDLDHFKQVNDVHGHAAGDAVLQAFARISLKKLRGTDIMARHGGEEFLLFIPSDTVAAAEHCVQRIRETLAHTVFDGLPEDFRITMSGGLTHHQPGEPIASTLERADAALYQAKASGRNRIETA